MRWTLILRKNWEIVWSKVTPWRILQVNVDCPACETTWRLEPQRGWCVDRWGYVAFKGGRPPRIRCSECQRRYEIQLDEWCAGAMKSG